MCQAQQQSASLGYSPMPINLVTASFEQIAKIPGAEVAEHQHPGVQQPDVLARRHQRARPRTRRSPQECDKQGPSQCATGTGGLQAVETPVAPAAAAGAGGPTDPGAAAGGGGATTGGATTGGATTGGATTGGATTAGGATGGATTGGATTDGSTTTGAATDGTGAVTGAEVCDPDTGICGPTAQAAGGGAVASGGQVGAVIPTTLDQNSGWGSKQTLMLIVVLFTLGLVFIPAYAWRKMAAAPPSPSSQVAPIGQPVAKDQVSV